MSHMTLQDIIKSEYLIPPNTLHARLKRGMFSQLSFDECVRKADEFTASGADIVTAIQVTSERIAELQRAVDSMQAVLDAGPIRKEEQPCQ
jgi:hypothetical protein